MGNLTDLLHAGAADAASRQAEQELAAAPDALFPHYGAIVGAFMERAYARMDASYDRFLRAMEAKQGSWAQDDCRLAGRIADQFVRLSETVLSQGGQRAMEPARLALLADQTLLAEHWATEGGDAATAAAARAAAEHFWRFHGLGGQGQSRTFWRLGTPLELQVEPTNHCNLKCTMCPRTTVMTRGVGHMTAEIWDRILDTWSGRESDFAFSDPLTERPLFQAKVRGTIKLFYLGELLMHPEFERFIVTARDRGVTLAVQTNGTLLQKRSTRRRLLDARPSVLGISLDGFSADSYQTVRQGARWETVKTAIEAFVSERDEMGLRDEIQLYITSVDPGYQPEIIQQAKEFFATVASGAIPMHFISLTTTNPTEFLSPQGEMRSYEFAPAYTVFADRPSCWEPLQKMQVLWDGVVSACCLVPDDDFRLGHVRDGVDAVWNSASMRSLQRAHLEHDLEEYSVCQQCLGVDAKVRPIPRGVTPGRTGALAAPVRP